MVAIASFLENWTLGICWWDIPGLVLLVAAITFVVISKRNLKKEREALEKG